MDNLIGERDNIHTNRTKKIKISFLIFLLKIMKSQRVKM
jgi:hypothetical protein